MRSSPLFPPFVGFLEFASFVPCLPYIRFLFHFPPYIRIHANNSGRRVKVNVEKGGYFFLLFILLALYKQAIRELSVCMNFLFLQKFGLVQSSRRNTATSLGSATKPFKQNITGRLVCGKSTCVIYNCYFYTHSFLSFPTITLLLHSLRQNPSKEIIEGLFFVWQKCALQCNISKSKVAKKAKFIKTNGIILDFYYKWYIKLKHFNQRFKVVLGALLTLIKQ